MQQPKDIDWQGKWRHVHLHSPHHFSGKWKSFNYVRLFAMPWTVVHGILQDRILEAVPSSRGSSQPRDWTQVSHIADGLFTNWAIKEA